MNKKINIALVGCGKIGKKHARIIQNNNQFNLVAIVDTKKNFEISDNLLSIPFFYNLRELSQSDVKVEVAVIATPNNFHSINAIECLDNGYHIIIEKPMALNKLQAEKIISKSIKVNKNVFIVMQNRFSPPLNWLKGIMKKNLLGKIYIVQLSCFWNRDDRYYENHSWHGKKDLDGGTLFTQFSHFIDLLYWLFGDIRNIVAKLKNFNHTKYIQFEDTGFITFDFINGGSGSINYTTSVMDKNFESSLNIIAENGTIKISGQYMNKLEYCKIKNYESPNFSYNDVIDKHSLYTDKPENHYYIYENVIDVLNNNAEIKTNAKEGMKVTEIIEKIYQAGNYK